MIDTDILNGIWATYDGGNGDATLKLYKRLEACGPLGFICMNLFRASKASQDAKSYKGMKSKGQDRAGAYLRKQWSIALLVGALEKHRIGITWGWHEDPAVATGTRMRWVLFIDTPFGQAGFHGANRGDGPHYDKAWDGHRGKSIGRIIKWCAKVLSEHEANK